MSIGHSQNMAFFCNVSSHSFSGSGPLGPVRKILVVRSSPKGLQFARSIGTQCQKSIDFVIREPLEFAPTVDQSNSLRVTIQGVYFIIVL